MAKGLKLSPLRTPKILEKRPGGNDLLVTYVDQENLEEYCQSAFTYTGSILADNPYLLPVKRLGL